MTNFSIKELKELKNIIENKTEKNLKEYFKKFQKIIGINKFLINLISNNYIDKENNIFLTLFRILWNEIEIEEVKWKDHVFELGMISYFYGKMDKPFFISLWNKFRSKNLINTDSIIHFSYLAYPKKEFEFNLFLDLNNSNAKMLGSDIPKLADIILIFETITEKDVPDYMQNISNTIESILSRPEFSNEIIESCSLDELEDILDWVPWNLRSSIVKRIIKEKIKDTKNLKSLEEKFHEDSFLNQLPLSMNVLEEKIELLESNPIKNDTFSNVPQKFINKWAPKFVYGSIKVPETDPHIQVFFPGGKHIGHSGIVVKTRIGSVLLDFGMSVVNNTVSSWLPIISHVDAVLLSHAHSDHSGAIPYLMTHNMELPIITRSETKKLVTPLWFNGASIIKRNYDRSILKSNNILKGITRKKNINLALDNMYEIKTKEKIKLFPGFEVTPYEASHLFGSVGFELNIAGKRLFYTGDFNADGTKIFSGTDFPTDVDAFIFDGTYYGKNDTDQGKNKETPLQEIMSDSSRILAPAFSLGRSQEILHELKKINAYKTWKIYMTGMGGRIASDLNLVSGMGKPTDKKGLHIVSTVKEEDFSENTIVIAGQGMLQSGTSRKLFDYTASDEETTVVFSGFQAPSSMGNQLLTKHPYLKKKYKQRLERIKISGHTSAETLENILGQHSGKKIIVHSPENAVIDEKRLDIMVPNNLKPITF